jgi:branched-chain amino acid transport system substrate-binding protein
MKASLLTALVGVAMAAGCSGGGGGTITIGAILSQTGGLASIGKEELQAAQLAVDEINKAGGVLGKTLKIENRDDGTDNAKARTAADALVALKVPAIVGAIGSGKTLAAAEATIPAGIVLMSGSSTSPELTTLADSGLVFRACPSDALQGKVLAKRAKAKFANVAILHIKNDAYGTGLADAFESSFTALGGTVTDKVGFDEGATSFSALLTSIYTKNPEAILLVAYPPEGAQIIKDYNTAFSAKNTFWYFTDATADKDFVTLVGGSNFTFQHEGSVPGPPSGSGFNAYLAAFKAKYGTDASAGSFSANVYDIVYLFAAAMQAGKAETAAAIRDNLAKVATMGGTVASPGSWSTMASTLSAGGDINFEGASGSLEIDGTGEPPTSLYNIWAVQGGVITETVNGLTP